MPDNATVIVLLIHDGSDFEHIRDCRRPKRIPDFFEISDYGHIRDCRNRGKWQ